MKQSTKLDKQITNNRAKLAAARLTRNEAEVLALHLFDGFSAVEIADRLAITKRAAQRRLRAAKKKLTAAGITPPIPQLPPKVIQITNNEWQELAAPKPLARDKRPIPNRINACN